MKLPRAAPQYSMDTQARSNQTLESEDLRNRKTGSDLALTSERLTILSPNGTNYQIIITDSGAVRAVPAALGRALPGMTAETGLFTLTGFTIPATWSTYTPVVSSSAGAITSYTASGRYQQIGKTVFVAIDVSITNNGTGSAAVNITLPVTANAAIVQILSGSEAQTTGKAIKGIIGTAGGFSNTAANVRNYDNTYPAPTRLALTGFYEAA